MEDNTSSDTIGTKVRMMKMVTYQLLGILTKRSDLTMKVYPRTLSTSL